MFQYGDEIETITEEQFHEYLALCKKIETLADDLEANYYMILGIDVIYPKNLTPLSRVRWFQIMNANNDRLQKRDWNVVKIFPNSMNCVQFSADEDGTAYELFEQYSQCLSSICDRYYALPVPDVFAWRTPFDAECDIEDRPLSLLSMALNTDPILIQLGHIDGLDNFDPVDPEGVELAGCHCSNFFEYAGRALRAWLPHNIRIGQAQVTTPTPDLGQQAPVTTPTSDLGQQELLPLVITIKKGQDGFQLHAEGKPIIFLGLELQWLFGAFAKKAAHDAAGEIVPWAILNQLASSEPSPDRNANEKVRAFLFRLRKVLADQWGKPEDGQDWIVTSRGGKGAHLTTTCKWKVEKQLKRELTGKKSQNAGARIRDPQGMAATIPNREDRLPARSVHSKQIENDDHYGDKSRRR